MFSGSNAYLGGNSGRPGGPQQYGSQQGNGFNPQQQQSQQPGFGQAPLQQQFTGYPMQAQPTGFQPQSTGFQAQQHQQPLQQQYTGFTGQSQSHFNGAPQQSYQGAPPMPQIPSQYQNQQTGAPPMPSIPNQFQQQQQQQGLVATSSAPSPISTQPTGFSQMAASFQAAPTGPSKPKGRRQSKAGVKIPNIRLSFITAQDQAKFETLFKSAVGDNGQTLSGDKARDLLLRSKLDGSSLSQIWTLSDTTRSGQLHFPEFALAMYLCNLKLVGKQLPSALPENIRNEVSSMVDIISFGIADDGPAVESASNVPDFARANAATPPTIQQPQPMQSNSALLSAQMTGFPNQFQQQQTGFQQPQATGFGQQMQPQQTGFTGASNSSTSYNGPRPPLPPMPTGFGGQGLPLPQTGMGGMVAPLNSQPTGMPGKWGLVNAPSTGLPNIDLLQARMMPQQGREQGSFTTAGLAGNAVIPWAVTKDEKTRYDALFKAWDGLNKGFIGGDVAIEVFGQSGLEKPDLERVWTLADHGNKGRLNMDEFAVAMHLIYRKLNGYPLPNQLPPELVPPSTRTLNDSINNVKSLLHQESDFRKNSGANLLPQKTGVSYLKNHSFRGGNGGFGTSRKDATVFKNNDDDVGYKSSARRRLGNSSPRPSSPASSVTSNDDMSLEQLKKKIREKQVLLDAIDFKHENAADEDDILDRKDRREADDLYHRIRRIQEDIDLHPDAALRNVDSGAERRSLRRQLQVLTDKLPEIASQVRKTERNIADAKLELFRLKDAKAHPGSASSIVGTGPGGSVTESDRLKARAKAMMQQRSAALTGKKIDSTGDDFDAPKRLEEENLRIRTEKENNERMVKDIEDSIRDFSRGLEDSLKEGAEDSTSEHERRRWEDGLGVEDEVKEFIFDLQRSSRTTRVRNEDRTRSGRRGEASQSSPHLETPVAAASLSSETQKTAPLTQSAGGSYSSYKTPEERAAFIKQQAEQRMAERLAALGIKAPTKSGETTQQRMEREKEERATKLRQAEEEDARREFERQARLAEEQGIAPPVAAASVKKPPPPPSRKAAKSDAGEREAARQAEEERVLKEQEAQQLATKNLEDDAARQEAELVKDQQAAADRLKALEEQVRAGKMKKEEEKRKKKAAQAQAKEKEARLAAQRTEIEAAQARERELQRQLEAIDNSDSSDDEDLEQATPQASTPTHDSQELGSKEATPPPVPSVPSVIATSPQAETETRNPFLKKIAQSGDSGIPSTQPIGSITSPPASSATSTNPFHRLTQEQLKAPEPLQTQPTGARPSRARPEEDEWSVVDSDKDDDSSDDEGPGAGNARQLASMLFGTMAPPRPLSAAGNGGSTSSSPAPVTEAISSPPAAPPMPGSFTPPPPAMPDASVPPPPPMPGAGAPGGPPPPPPIMGAPMPPPPPPPPGSAPAPPTGASRPQGFLGEIQLGKALKKTQTKDKSQAAVAGRVLG